MIWKFIGASSIGTSHQDIGEQCQDNCYFNSISLTDENCIFLGLTSDGAGSSSQGAKGAEIACGLAKDIIEKWLINSGQFKNLNKELIREWVIKIHNEISDIAYKNNSVPREYACTLLVNFTGFDYSVSFQIGDGAIIYRKNNILGPVFWPDNGEYSNTTYFITDDDFLDHLRINITNSPPDEIAMFSDGLQMLALVYKSYTIHEPFFDPMFSALRNTDHNDCVKLNEQLQLFLDSPSINERTDDDKTLILATRIDRLKLKE